jgi:hypothetical protein
MHVLANGICLQVAPLLHASALLAGYIAAVDAGAACQVSLLGCRHMPLAVYSTPLEHACSAHSSVQRRPLDMHALTVMQLAHACVHSIALGMGLPCLAPSAAGTCGHTGAFRRWHAERRWRLHAGSSSFLQHAVSGCCCACTLDWGMGVPDCWIPLLGSCQCFFADLQAECTATLLMQNLQSAMRMVTKLFQMGSERNAKLAPV